MKNSGFTLIEIIVILLIASSIMAISIVGGSAFKDSLEYNLSVSQVASDIKLTRQLAETSSQTCRIEFRAGKNIYAISKGGSIYRSSSAGRKIQFAGKSYFSFVPSGCTDVGGSGTLMMGGSARAKKIVVSSKGRIRIE